MKSLDSNMSPNSKKVTEMLEDEIGYISSDSILVSNDRRVYVKAISTMRPQRPSDDYVKIIKRQDTFIIPEACLKELSQRIFPYNLTDLPFEFIQVLLVDRSGRCSEYLPDAFEIERLELMEDGESSWIDPYDTIHLDNNRNIFLDLDSEISVSRTEFCNVKIIKRDGYFLIMGKSLSGRIPYHQLTEEMPERTVQAFFLYQNGLVSRKQEVLAIWPEYLDDFYIESLSEGESGFIGLDSFVLPPKGDRAFILSRGDFSYEYSDETEIQVTKKGGAFIVDGTILRQLRMSIPRMSLDEYLELDDLLLAVTFLDEGKIILEIPKYLIAETDELEDED